MMQKLLCTCKDPYEIIFFPSTLKSTTHLSEEIKQLSPPVSKFTIITDDDVAELHGKEFISNLLASGIDVRLFSFPSGEKYKTRETKEILENALFDNGYSKDTCVIALGGGVVLDVAGYVAATFCRGVPLIMVPTSLLGMVDACIGGKTGINVPQGKNMVGCIYPPSKVLIDLKFLETLPKKELVNGIVEAIKHGLIADINLFIYLEEHCDLVLGLKQETIEKVIFESCRIKKEIVEKDEKESGKRRLLNFGHTVGHAIEKVMNYSLPHGEAVALGIITESYLSMKLGALCFPDFERIKNIIKKYSFPLNSLKNLGLDEILNAMTIDKKSLKNRPRFVIIDKIGSCMNYDFNYCTHVNENLIKEALTYTHDLHCHYRADF